MNISRNKILRFQEFLKASSKEVLEEVNHVINEGGAYGHLMHPFEDYQLTFGDLKQMIDLTVKGAFNPDNFVQEKTDGQNLLFTFKDGKIRAARSSRHLKNYGQAAMTKEEVAAMFQGRGELQVAFTEALNDLEAAIQKLSPQQITKIFGEGKKFMSVEVIYPATQNVIPYGQAMLVFHGTHEYDQQGNLLRQNKDDARILADLIQKINQNIQKTFFIRGPLDLQLEKMPDTSKKKAYYENKLKKIMSDFNMRENNTISDYLEKRWKDFLLKKLEDFNLKNLSEEILEHLIRRWAHKDRSYTLNHMKRDGLPLEFIEWIRNFEKTSYDSQFKDFIQPLEHLFLELGADILMNIKNFLTANPRQATEKIRQELQTTIDKIRKSDNIENIRKLERELQRIEAAGGLKRLVPSEGITFVYKGKLYKYTGLFSAINKINGILKFGR